MFSPFFCFAAFINFSFNIFQSNVFPSIIQTLIWASIHWCFVASSVWYLPYFGLLTFWCCSPDSDYFFYFFLALVCFHLVMFWHSWLNICLLATFSEFFLATISCWCWGTSFNQGFIQYQCFSYSSFQYYTYPSFGLIYALFFVSNPFFLCFRSWCCLKFSGLGVVLIGVSGSCLTLGGVNG